MKLLTLLMTLMLFTGCELGGVLGPLSLSKKKDNRVKDSEQDKRIDDIERRLKLLNDIINSQQNVLNLYSGYFTDLADVDALLQDLIDDLIARLDNLEDQVDDNQDSVQTALTSINTSITNLQLAAQYNIVDVVDPCGDGPGFDEVLLVLGNGGIIAYFEQGSNRHLSLIPAGNYQTTDAQKCNFTVGTDGSISF